MPVERHLRHARFGNDPVDAGRAQPLAFAVDHTAQGRINSLYMTAIFLGGALGVMISGWLMGRYGWPGNVAFGVALGLMAAAYHWIPRQESVTHHPNRTAHRTPAHRTDRPG
ncbi:MAG TPA: MFS transporter [Pinirhizobacter sp.]